MITTKTTRHCLHNAHGWTLTYLVHGDEVTLVRRYRGSPVERTTMTRDEARRHWRRMRAQGFGTTGTR